MAVLGAGGTIAPAIVRDLAESRGGGARCACSTSTRAREAVADEHGGGRARARGGRRPLDGGGLAAALADVDVLVNSASYRVNVAAMAGLPRGRAATTSTSAACTG